MSQDRGRRHYRIRSLSPPQRAKSRSHSRDHSGSRPRDASPFSIDSKLASNYIINNPFTNSNSRLDKNSPILEDDETEIELAPILPQFSSRTNESADLSELNEIPLPLENNNGEISQVIEDDFKKQFNKDLKIKDLKKNNDKSKNDRNKNITNTDSSIEFSTDSDASNFKDKSDVEQTYNNRLQGTSSNFPSQLDLSDYSPDYNKFNEKNHPNLNNTLKSINNRQNESKPGFIPRWFGNINSNLSIGNVMKKNINDKKIKRRNDIENNLYPNKSSSSKLFNIANKFVHGKSNNLSDYDYDEADFDDILNSVRKEKSHNGITSSLMKLYNQKSDIEDAEEEEEEEEDYYYGDSEDDYNSHNYGHANLPLNMADKVKNFKNSFSRDNSRERFYSKSKSKQFEDIKLPNFKLGKEDKRIKKIRRKTKKEKAARITVHIVDLIHRQEFLLTLCKAFMKFGAPNHRLEEYLTLTAQVLEVEATFIYLPGMMIVNFSDPITRTSDLKLVRVGQGLNLNKLDLAHDIYESVVYDRIGVDEASKELNKLFESKEFLNVYWIILFYGISSMFVIIFFNGAWLDMIPSFCLGGLLGFLQCVIAPKNEIYSSVFEIGSAILISFIGRAIGSISNGKYFCFSAIVLSGLCMILPGYMILRGALEIQSKSIISGVVGMFYAIIYSLFLGFGITLGSALYGWIDKNAINQTTCSNIGKIPNIWRILFIPIYNIFMSLSCQARFHQLSIMIIIASCGYVVTYFSSLHFSLTQFNSALGSFTVGLLSNIYDRWLKNYKKIGYCSTQFSSMICGIFDLVPGSVAAKNALSSGLLEIENANNGNNSNSMTDYSTMTFGITMIEIAIGITVGLFMSTLVVYPFGKNKRNNNSSSIGL